MSSRKIDFDGRSWSAIAQDHHLDWAGNPNFPDYMRIVFVAYGRHAANGHAVLERGELAAYLVRKTGVLPDRRQVWAAMNKSVRLGYLRQGSRLECLIVNDENVQGGMGELDKRCRRDHKTPSKAVASERAINGRFATSDGAENRRSVTSDGAETGHSEASDGRENRRSTLNPSLSSTTGALAPVRLHAVPRKDAS